MSTGPQGVRQVIDVLGNDSVAPGTNATLDVSTLKLCGPNNTAPNCTLTSLETVDGTYVVNADGTVSFMPAAGFFGTVTSPPTYSITDSLGQSASSTITPTVIQDPVDPPSSDPPVATPAVPVHLASLAATGSNVDWMAFSSLLCFSVGGVLLTGLSVKRKHRTNG